MDQSFLQRVYYHNTVQDYIIAAAIIFIGWLLVRFFKSIILQRLMRWAKRTTTSFDDFIVHSVERFVVPAFYFAVVYMGLTYLRFSKEGENVIRVATTVAITFLLIRLFSATILVLLQSYVRKQERGEDKVKQLGGLMLIINVFIWIIGLVFLFDNMGYNVTTVITGLGIGGIAVALAAQNILGDVFNYFVIFFDRPFETGDFIVIDDKSGTVDYIGLKTTRVQSISGEQLVFSNSDLTDSRIHNYKRMQKRRVEFKLGVTYQTSLENLKAIPDLIKSIVEEQQPVVFDRAHFAKYEDSSLTYDVVYNILDSDYTKYMNIHQNINFRIFEEFQNRGIEFAYPTRTVLVVPQPPEAN
ncbi:mechanosensitive ion channel [Nibribacter ruber]|uniref:Mechanosensitive ion channel n=1 Tax=Nibribacter ruber TaxID=2698458 RepID=A0A6P1P315_9BACT|nr:mechanosensitive ion channel family protein [Nibribacter ruber]QHL88814.1 mechanosensitive ion channel [Nibribacter ruber]